jgi:hypothetical protein
VIKNRFILTVEQNAGSIIQLSPVVSMQVLVIALLLKILMRRRFSIMQVYHFLFFLSQTCSSRYRSVYSKG